MRDNMNIDLLGQLFERIERAWLDDHDRTIIYKLGEQHPEYREQLYEFFEDLVLGPEDQVVSENFMRAEGRITEWLESTGFGFARRAADLHGTPPTTTESATLTTTSRSGCETTTEEVNSSESQLQPLPTTWVMFLRQRTKRAIPMIVKKLRNVTSEYLILVSRHPNIVPTTVKATLAHDIEQVWGISTSDSFRYLSVEPSPVRAASRSRPFEREPKTFEELLDRSAFTREQRSFWLQLKSEQ